MKISLTVLLAAIFLTAKTVVPSYPAAIGGNALARDEVIQTYFNLGFKPQEIVLFLGSVHGVCIPSNVRVVFLFNHPMPRDHR